MKSKTLTLSTARHFALLALVGGASLTAVQAEQTLRYNFESLPAVLTNDIEVTNLVAGATQNGILKNAAKFELLNSESVIVDDVKYLLGKSLKFKSLAAEGITAAHIDTGLNPTGWKMARGNKLNRKYTAMAWVYFNDIVGENHIFGQAGGTNDEVLHLGSREGKFISGHYGDDIGPDQGQNVQTGTGSWQHVAFVNDADNKQSIFRNGALILGPGAGITISNGASGHLLIGTGETFDTGSFIGALDEVKIFGDQALSAEEIRTQMTNTLTAATLAAITSSKLDNTAFTFTFEDFGNFPSGSVLDKTTVKLKIDSILVTPTSVEKADGITTIIFNVPSPYLSFSTHTFEITAKDQTNPTIPNIKASGSLKAPILPLLLPSPAVTVGVWTLREHRNALIGNSTFAGIDALAAQLAADPTSANNTVFDGTALVMNHSQPGAVGDQGNFNNDFPFIGHVAAVPDDNIAFLGKTKLVITSSEIGSRTFSIHSNDGFAFRISGGPVGNTSRFLSTNVTSTNRGIDPSDSRTIFYQGATTDSAITGVYDFSEAGTYDLEFVSVNGTGDSFFEIASAPGTFTWDRETTTWTLVGNPSDPSVANRPFSPRFVNPLPGPAGGVGTFGIRTYFEVSGNSAFETNAWLAANGATTLPGPGSLNTFDVQRNVLNLSDNRTAAGTLVNFGFVAGDDALPDARVDRDNVVTTAHGRITVPTSATYTFSARGDDGFLLRIKAVSGPNPVFSKVTHSNSNSGSAKLEMSNLNEMFYADNPSSNSNNDSDTRGIISLEAGQYDIEYFHWQSSGDFAYELTAAEGEFPHLSNPNNPPSGWKAVGYEPKSPAAASQPQISAPGWTVKSTAPGSVSGGTNVATALAALADGSTTSTWDQLNFADPQAGGAPVTGAVSVAWPNNTAADDNNFAVSATATLTVTTSATYRLGYQGDDGGYLIIRGLGATATPSFSPFLLENAGSLSSLVAENPASPAILNKLLTDTGTDNSRTIGSIVLAAGSYQLEALYFEGTGNSNWSVIGSIEPVTSTNYFPLSKNGITPSVLPPFLPLGASAVESISVTNFTYNPSTGGFSLSFASELGSNYQLEYSTAMQGGAAGAPAQWNIAPGNATAGQAGTTTISRNLNTLQPTNGGVLPVNAPRAFLRVRRL